MIRSSVRWLAALSTRCPTVPSTMRRTTIARKAARSFVCTRAGARETRRTARSLIPLIFVQEAEEITPELLWIETHPEILDPQAAAGVDERGQCRVVDATVRCLGYEYTVPVRDFSDCGR